MTGDDRPLRRIRSFVRREGRLTAGQARSLEQYWPRYGIESDAGPVDLPTLFGREARRIVEIGFGMGDSLAAMAAADPQTDFIGIEVHRPGVGRLLGLAGEAGLDNLRVVCGDAVPFFESCLPADSIDGVHLFFPDPWHKKRHHKRRLVQPEFVRALCRPLRDGGYLHVATDWEDYARHTLKVLSADPHLQNTATDGLWVPRPAYRPETKFERRGQRLGHGIWDIVFRYAPPGTAPPDASPR